MCASLLPATEHLDLAFFVPWVESGSGLPYVEGLIHQRLADLASRRHSTLILKCLAGGESLEERVLNAAKSLIDLRVDGVFYYPAELPGDQMQLNRIVVDMLVAAGIRVVLIDRDIVPFPGRSEFTRIGYDNRRGGVVLTEHLIQVGCRRIAFVGIPEVSTAVADRLAGYYEAHRMHGLSVDRKLVHMVDEVELTRSFCDELMRRDKPDAIISKMDRFAALIGRHLMAQGLADWAGHQAGRFRRRSDRGVAAGSLDDDSPAGSVVRTSRLRSNVGQRHRCRYRPAADSHRRGIGGSRLDRRQCGAALLHVHDCFKRQWQ